MRSTCQVGMCDFRKLLNHFAAAWTALKVLKSLSAVLTWGFLLNNQYKHIICSIATSHLQLAPRPFWFSLSFWRDRGWRPFCHDPICMSLLNGICYRFDVSIAMLLSDCWFGFFMLRKASDLMKTCRSAMYELNWNDESRFHILTVSIP